MQSSGRKPTAEQCTGKKLNMFALCLLHKVLEYFAAFFVMMHKLKTQNIQRRVERFSSQKKKKKKAFMNSVEVSLELRSLRILLFTKGKLEFGSKI